MAKARGHEIARVQLTVSPMSVRVEPDRLIVVTGNPVEWRLNIVGGRREWDIQPFELSTLNIDVTIYFEARSPFVWRSRTLRVPFQGPSRVVHEHGGEPRDYRVRDGQLGVHIAEQPGDYKYGVSARRVGGRWNDEPKSMQAIGDVDPWLLVLPA